MEWFLIFNSKTFHCRFAKRNFEPKIIPFGFPSNLLELKFHIFLILLQSMKVQRSVEPLELSGEQIFNEVHLGSSNIF